MGKKSWQQIKQEVREELWPFPTEAKTQVKVHDKYLLEGIMDLQKWVHCLQSKNTSQIRFCSTFFQCGKTVVEAPNFGVINRIYTIANDDWCDPVYYRSSNIIRIECWTRAYLEYATPTNDGLPPLPMGFKYAEATSDNDCAGGRARSGMWAIHRHRLYVTPWLQSNEKLIVEWDGIKPDWQDTDMLDDTLWTARVLAALRGFVEWKHCARFGDDVSRTSLLERQYKNDLADLMHDCRESTMQQHDETCAADEQPFISQAQLDDDVLPTDPAPIVLAAVGDYGVGGEIIPIGDGEDAPPDNLYYRNVVAALVASWAPSKFIGIGDLFYGGTATLASLLNRTPAEYQALVEAGNFLPVIGNHDRDPVGHLPVVRDYFTFPDIATASGPVTSPGYYSAALDPRVEIFVIDTGYNNAQVNQQADGVTATSAQAAWLRVALARSTATFKLVFGHHPPYTSFRSGAVGPTISSDGFLAYPEIRWPFKAWGATAYFCGHIHAYERLEVDGFPILVVGSGGRAAEDFDEDNLSPYSVFRHNGFGAMKFSVACDTLTMEFYDDSGVLLDTLTIEAA